MTTRYLWRVEILIYFSSFLIKLLATGPIDVPSEIICKSLDIRRTTVLKALPQCTVVEGDVILSFVRLPTNTSLPYIREITGSLLIYDVRGLESLAQLLPHLVLIRGQNRIDRYALVIKNTGFRDCALPSLRLIKRGSIRLEDNPYLCYVHTVNWMALTDYRADILKTGMNGITCFDQCPANCSFRAPERIPLAPNMYSFCWSSGLCQSFCATNCTKRHLACHLQNVEKCCHPECLGGCYGDGSDKCVSCSHASHNGSCILACPEGTVRYLNRRCVTHVECLHSIPTAIHSTSTLTISHSTEPIANTPVPDWHTYAIFNQSCIEHCPLGYIRHNVTGHCEPCAERCPRKQCPGFFIYSLHDLDALRGCWSAKAVYISIQNGEPDQTTEALTDAFATLRVIEHSLRIVRSPSIVSLKFLNNLKRIGPIVTETSNTIALEVSGNENLQTLWSMNGTASNGRALQLWSTSPIRFTENSLLCPELILDLFATGALELMPSTRSLTEAEQNLIRTTNGDLAYCNIDTFHLEMSNITSSSVGVRWPNHILQSTVTSLNRNSVSTGVVVALSFIHLCHVSDDHSSSEKFEFNKSFRCRILQVFCTLVYDENCFYQLTGLEAATSYSMSMEIRYPLLRSKVHSGLVQYTTATTTPSVPRYAWLEPSGDVSLRLTWMNPSKPSGIISHYLLWVKVLLPRREDFTLHNFCLKKPEWLVPDPKHVYTPPVNQLVSGSHLNSSSSPECRQCSSQCPGLEFSEDKFGSVNFRNMNVPWPLSGSLWTLSDRGKPLPVYIGNLNGELDSIQNSDVVGLIVIPANDGVMDVEHTQYIRSLRPFSRVVVELGACQTHPANESPGAICRTQAPWLSLLSDELVYLERDRAHWSNCEQELCSQRITVNGLVPSKAGADELPSHSMNIQSHGVGAVKITWREPANPNGLVLYYVVRYRSTPYPVTWKGSKSDEQENDTETQLSGSNFSATAKFVELPNDSNKIAWLTKCISFRQWLTVHGENSTVRVNGTREPTLGGTIIRSLHAGDYLFQIQAVSLAGAGPWGPLRVFTINSYIEASHERWSARHILIAGFNCALVLLLLAVGLIAIGLQLRKRYLRSTAWNSLNPGYCDIYDVVDAWEIDLANIDTQNWNHPLGHGSFGTVYRGTLRSLTTPASTLYPDSSNISVAIKTINNTTTLFDRRDFITEACHMKQFHSYHLVCLFGLVTRTSANERPLHHYCISLRNLLGRIQSFLQFSHVTQLNSTSCHQESTFYTDCPSYSADPQVIRCPYDRRTQRLHSAHDVAPNSPLVVMELMAEGDLVKYLRHLGDTGLGFVEPAQVYLWATQISDGMAYLAAKNYVHRDLAARNCLVDARLVVKIGDFGLCRHVYAQQYYHKKISGRLPIRWMAPESLLKAHFTSQSDVWSYGVVLWEIATMACLPYRGMSHEQVIQFILGRNNLITNCVPTNCPGLLSALMSHCWAYEPTKRPTFLRICALLCPRFGDAHFRNASFYYQGERRLTHQPNAPTLEAPARLVIDQQGQLVDETLDCILNSVPCCNAMQLDTHGNTDSFPCSILQDPLTPDPENDDRCFFTTSEMSI